MRCPRHYAAILEPQILLGVEVDCCPLCSGIWLDAGELEPILGAMTGESPPESDAPACAEDEAPMRCPRCGAVAVLVHTPLARVNLCSACHGLWLDAHELGKLKELHDAGQLDSLLSRR